MTRHTDLTGEAAITDALAEAGITDGITITRDTVTIPRLTALDRFAAALTDRGYHIGQRIYGDHGVTLTVYPATGPGSDPATGPPATPVPLDREAARARLDTIGDVAAAVARNSLKECADSDFARHAHAQLGYITAEATAIRRILGGQATP